MGRMIARRKRSASPGPLPSDLAALPDDVLDAIFQRAAGTLELPLMLQLGPDAALRYLSLRCKQGPVLLHTLSRRDLQVLTWLASHRAQDMRRLDIRLHIHIEGNRGRPLFRWCLRRRILNYLPTEASVLRMQSAACLCTCRSGPQWGSSLHAAAFEEIAVG